MRFGIIGTGMVARFHVKAIEAMNEGELAGVAGIDSSSTESFARENQTTAYTSVDAMLADASVDVVTIATPSGAHLEPALAAIEAGKHVLVEKPLEITTDRIDTMVTAAERKGVTLAAILNRRYHPAVDAMKAAVDGGRLGRLTSASAYIKWYRDQAYYDSAAWRGTWALDGGGVLMNQSIHTIDKLLHIAGPVRSVQANTACLAHENIEVEDMGVALLEFENGARGVIEGSSCSWSKDGHPARVQLCGTDGSVFLADEAFEVWDFKETRPEDAEIRDKYMQGGGGGVGANDPNAMNFVQHQRNFEEVLEAIKEHRAPATCAAEARRGVELLQAIYQSARNGGARVVLGAPGSSR